jgi:hypothetical protein
MPAAAGPTFPDPGIPDAKSDLERLQDEAVERLVYAPE